MLKQKGAQPQVRVWPCASTPGLKGGQSPLGPQAVGAGHEQRAPPFNDCYLDFHWKDLVEAQILASQINILSMACTSSIFLV